MTRFWVVLLAIFVTGIFTVANPQPSQGEDKAFEKTQGKHKLTTCMICGKSLKAFPRHLKTAHDMKLQEYRKQFDIPRTTETEKEIKITPEELGGF